VVGLREDVVAKVDDADDMEVRVVQKVWDLLTTRFQTANSAVAVYITGELMYIA
jgi:hypothetical protein